MYPTGCVPPKFYGLPKIHKPDTPLRSIVSSCGSVTYGVAKELAKILKPLVCKSPHHINSTQDFVEQAKHFKLEAGECLSSYDVSALFTSVPIDPALNIIKDLLDKDTTLKERTVMEVGDIILLLEFCLKNTYFSFQGQFYEQVEGAAMGSPVSPIVANLYMEYLEQKALSTDIILLLEFCLKNTYFSFQGQFYEQVEGAAMGSPVSPIVANLYMEYLEQKALSTAPNPLSSGAGM